MMPSRTKHLHDSTGITTQNTVTVKRVAASQNETRLLTLQLAKPRHFAEAILRTYKEFLYGDIILPIYFVKMC
jgi:hypothetical protein